MNEYFALMRAYYGPDATNADATRCLARQEAQGWAAGGATRWMMLGVEGSGHHLVSEFNGILNESGKPHTLANVGSFPSGFRWRRVVNGSYEVGPLNNRPSPFGLVQSLYDNSTRFVVLVREPQQSLLSSQRRFCSCSTMQQWALSAVHTEKHLSGLCVQCNAKRPFRSSL